MNKLDFVTHLVELAQEVESEYPIDWSGLNVDKYNAYRLLAPSLIEMYDNMLEGTREETLLAIILALQVENFGLNLKVLQ